MLDRRGAARLGRVLSSTDVAEVCRVLVSGLAAGWLMTKRVSGAVRFPAATLALTIAMGGTIPVVNGPRAGLLFVGFVPICAGSGLALAAARWCLTSRESS